MREPLPFRSYIIITNQPLPTARDLLEIRLK